jgi:hypothetical protein
MLHSDALLDELSFCWLGPAPATAADTVDLEPDPDAATDGSGTVDGANSSLGILIDIFD